MQSFGNRWFSQDCEIDKLYTKTKKILKIINIINIYIYANKSKKYA